VDPTFATTAENDERLTRVLRAVIQHGVWRNPQAEVDKVLKGEHERAREVTGCPELRECKAQMSRIVKAAEEKGPVETGVAMDGDWKEPVRVEVEEWLARRVEQGVKEWLKGQKRVEVQ